MGLGEEPQHWESRSQSPIYGSDMDDKKVMDLSYSGSSPLQLYGGNQVPESVLRLGHLLHRSPPSPPHRSTSPQPSRSVIVASHHHHHEQLYKPNGHLYMSHPPSPMARPLSSPQLAAATSSRKKKLPQPIPEECKDDAYWERRKRNNESAKRSRELRRTKEIQTSERVNYLETENLQLRTEVSMLRNEVEKLRQLLIPKSAIGS